MVMAITLGVIFLLMISVSGESLSLTNSCTLRQRGNKMFCAHGENQETEFALRKQIPTRTLIILNWNAEFVLRLEEMQKCLKKLIFSGVKPTECLNIQLGRNTLQIFVNDEDHLACVIQEENKYSTITPRERITKEHSMAKQDDSMHEDNRISPTTRRGRMPSSSSSATQDGVTKPTKQDDMTTHIQVISTQEQTDLEEMDLDELIMLILIPISGTVGLIILCIVCCICRRRRNAKPEDTGIQLQYVGSLPRAASEESIFSESWVRRCKSD